MRFPIDAQLPPALARQITSLGHDAEYVMDTGRTAASDRAIRTDATEIGAVIVTKDEDFAVHRLLHHGPAVVWIRVGNTRRPNCCGAWCRSFRRSSTRSSAVKRWWKSCSKVSRCDALWNAAGRRPPLSRAVAHPRRQSRPNLRHNRLVWTPSEPTPSAWLAVPQTRQGVYRSRCVQRGGTRASRHTNEHAGVALRVMGKVMGLF